MKYCDPGRGNGPVCESALCLTSMSFPRLRWAHWSSARRPRSFTEERIEVAPEFRLFRVREMASRSSAGAQRGTVAVVERGMSGPKGSGDLHQRTNIVATKPSSRRERITLHEIEGSRHEVRETPVVDQPNQYILSTQLAHLSEDTFTLGYFLGSLAIGAADHGDAGF